MEPTIAIGCARSDITSFRDGMTMAGYGVPTHRATRVAGRLSARAFVVGDGAVSRKLVFVCVELCFVSQSLRMGVLDRLADEHPELGVGEHELLLTATHTHSGPGGYSHYLFYDLLGEGYAPAVFAGLVRGIVDAVVRAHASMRPGRVYLDRADIPLSEDVAFNRSIDAYDRNPGAAGKGDPAAATNRAMTLLRFDAEDGAPLGAISFFAVHGTSVHADGDAIHPDNKGCAARFFEEHAARSLGAEGFVAAFAQGAAGDVSPNFRFDARRGLAVGACDDDLDSAAHNGAIQFRHAAALFASSMARGAIAPSVRGRVRHADFSAIEVDAEDAGAPGARTASAAIGVALLGGTAEGPGPLRSIPLVLPALRAIERASRALGRLFGAIPADDDQGSKLAFVETGKGRRGKVLGLIDMGDPQIPGVELGIRRIKALAERGALGDAPWTPSVLPVQVFVLGPLAIVAIPGEPTTMAGRRLEQVALAELASLGITQAVVCGYANAYAGYVTTREEYALQRYEGACTHFGPHTLGAFRTELRRVCREVVTGEPSRVAAPRPRRFDEAELRRRVHDDEAPRLGPASVPVPSVAWATPPPAGAAA